VISFLFAATNRSEFDCRINDAQVPQPGLLAGSLLTANSVSGVEGLKGG
jgi:hypothetical protein